MASVQISAQVFLAIQEHHRRLRYKQRAVGLLLARRQENFILVSGTLEYAFPFEGNTQELNSDFLDVKGIQDIQKLLRLSQGQNVRSDGLGEGASSFGDRQDEVSFIENLSELQLFGWYATQPNERATTPSNLSFHLNKIAKYDKSEFPHHEYVFLSYNTASQESNLYKCVHENFAEQPFSVLSSDAETVAIEAALHNSGKSPVAHELQKTYDAVHIYNEQIRQLLIHIESGKISKDLTLMRELNDLLNSFPGQSNEARFNAELLEQYASSQLLSMLQAITASFRVINNVYTLNSQFKVRQHQMHGVIN